MRYFDISKPIFIFTDAHVTGLGATLAQGETQDTANPVAVASRATTETESRYPQLDLEAMGVDFALRRFRNYIVGSPTSITVVTDHQPLVPIFNGKRTGSIRTERIKLRHQDIPFHLKYQKGKANQTDFLSRRGKPIKDLTPSEEAETTELNNLLYMLHATPVTDSIDLEKIADATKKDKTLQQLTNIIKNGLHIRKSDDTKIRKFEQLITEISVCGSGILLKGDRIILPESLQETAIQIAHRGSHPGQSGIERRLRSHFFFHNMLQEVQKYVSSCPECAIFTDKKTKEPQKAHKVPSQNWETVSVDLFGPMPSSHHVVVVQDLASRYPSAKLVSSTGAAKVLPALADIYDCMGNPENQLSDNGPPFNSAAMNSFAEKRGINLKKIPPLHPSSNPVETFMRPLGKAMKIGRTNHKTENNTIQQLLKDYRDTPHPSTGISPSAMMFRDGQRGAFPRNTATADQVAEARRIDSEEKHSRQTANNARKYVRKTVLQIGDSVLMRNYQRTMKFDPIFKPDICKVCVVNSTSITVENAAGKRFIRHPDDLRQVTPVRIDSEVNNDTVIVEDTLTCEHDTNYDSNDEPLIFQPHTEQLRRSNRATRPNQMYTGEQWVV